MTKLHQISATRAARMIASGELSSEALVRSCLERIAAREPVVKAWAHFDADSALAAARACDAAKPKGPLHGVPVAVKDVIDTCDMPTRMGSPIYEDHRPATDAACVAILRAAGAVILGKTVTAEFAGIAPGATTNPHDPARTPGGSSSGSAAAVADFMAPLALGTQTGGSVIRPASFCGVVGFKPSFGLVSRVGVKFCAESLDTIGVIARSVADARLTWRALVGLPHSLAPDLRDPPRFALVKTHHWPKASADSVAAVENAIARMQARGAVFDEIVAPPEFSELSRARTVINDYERARALAWEKSEHPAKISAAMTRVIDNGWSISFEAYLQAQRTAEHWRAWLDIHAQGYDALIGAAVNGEAPPGLTTTGDTSFQEIWTVLHVPTITLPLSLGASGMPLGVQLIGKRFHDERLLAVASWVMRDEPAASRQ